MTHRLAYWIGVLVAGAALVFAWIVPALACDDDPAHARAMKEQTRALEDQARSDREQNRLIKDRNKMIDQERRNRR